MRTETAAAAKETVLLAEDEEIVRRLVVELLLRAGFQVLAAANGELALETARTYAGPIHLLISDVAMPAMTGLELARRIGNLYPQIKILLVSGYSDPAAIDDLKQQAGFAYLRKPFTPQMLLEQARALLEVS
ncbi:MAG: response regulator [Acidobacteria bacterium]|nr:MAG: response regulator [Acidobacteriota bacterium]